MIEAWEDTELSQPVVDLEFCRKLARITTIAIEFTRHNRSLWQALNYSVLHFNWIDEGVFQLALLVIAHHRVEVILVLKGELV